MAEDTPVIQLMGFAVLMAFIAAGLGGYTPSPIRLACPPLIQYALQEQAALASEELRAHPELREVPVFLADYGNERAECRALNGKKSGD